MKSEIILAVQATKGRAATAVEVSFVDTHCHLDGEEFDLDRAEVMQRAREAGCKAIFLPAIDLPTSQRILTLSEQYTDWLYPMVGLHPEEVRADWREQLEQIKVLIHHPSSVSPLIAIGEVGLDFYWSREFEKEQLEAFEVQVQWSVETQLPLMIHCRKAQNEMVHIIKRYADPTSVPLDRLVLETDAPYMAPVPMRGQRNESSYIRHVITRLAEAYGVDELEICHHTNENVKKVFGIQV